MDEDVRYCWNCGHQVFPGHNFCRRCGSSLGRAATPFDEVEFTCEDCGKPVRFGTVSCPWCGAPRGWTGYAPMPPRGPGPEPKSPVEPMLPYVIGLFGTIILIAAAVAFIGERLVAR